MKRTGVIVGVEASLTVEQVKSIIDALTERFPAVEFAVVSGAHSVAFEYTPPAPIAPEIVLDPEFIDEGSGDYFGLWPRKGRK